jgi:hypothetical protein
MSDVPISRRHVFSASIVPASAIVPLCQRVTRRDTHRSVENVFSIGFVVASDLRSVGGPALQAEITLSRRWRLRPKTWRELLLA